MTKQAPLNVAHLSDIYGELLLRRVGYTPPLAQLRLKRGRAPAPALVGIA
jgi:hypothetical protein